MNLSPSKIHLLTTSPSCPVNMKWKLRDFGTSLDEYKLKCAEYEEKWEIQKLQQEKAGLMEAIKILSSDQSVGSHDPQPASDHWQPVTPNSSNNPKRGKTKKKGKANSQNQQLHLEDNDTGENG